MVRVAPAFLAFLSFLETPLGKSSSALKGRRPTCRARLVARVAFGAGWGDTGLGVVLA